MIFIFSQKLIAFRQNSMRFLCMPVCPHNVNLDLFWIHSTGTLSKKIVWMLFSNHQIKMPDFIYDLLNTGKLDGKGSEQATSRTSRILCTKNKKCRGHKQLSQWRGEICRVKHYSLFCSSAIGKWNMCDMNCILLMMRWDNVSTWCESVPVFYNMRCEWDQKPL